MKRTPRRPPTDPPSDGKPATCPTRTKGRKFCGYALKPGETHCWNHDPARAAERARLGAIRNGDPETELGTFQGITRRVVRILEELETGAVVVDAETGEKSFVPSLEPAVANARRNCLRFLAEMVARRDEKTKAAKVLDELSMGAGAAAGNKPTSLEDLT